MTGNTLLCCLSLEYAKGIFWIFSGYFPEMNTIFFRFWTWILYFNLLIKILPTTPVVPQPCILTCTTFASLGRDLQLCIFVLWCQHAFLIWSKSIAAQFGDWHASTQDDSVRCWPTRNPPVAWAFKRRTEINIYTEL